MQGNAPIIPTHTLPNGETIVFNTSTFFTRNKATRLPTPSEVLSQAASGSVAVDTVRGSKGQPAIFHKLGLIVKYGQAPRVSIAEGQCLWALRRYLPQVPVPEMYGWVTEGGRVFLYMELVDGSGLDCQWNQLSTQDREGICKHLQSILFNLRRLRQGPSEVFLGQINRQPYYDVMFTNGVRPRAGPFLSVKAFHDWLSLMSKQGAERHFPGKSIEEIPDPYRQLLPDDAAIVFTHADLHPSNIIISRAQPYTVLAIIDWGQSGWYPDYWEFCKAEYTALYGSEWQAKYIPSFLQEPNDSCIEGFDSYGQAFGY